MISKAVLVAAMLCPQLSAAQDFTSATVLEWSQAQQASLIRTSAVMVGVVAAQKAETAHIARCIDDWLYEEGSPSAEAAESVLAAMRQYPDYHPQVVILAVVQRECGNL